MFKKHLPLFIFLFVVSTFFTIIFNPKRAVAAVNHLLISQIQIAGATATDEFIELYNPTDNEVDLSGYRITKKVSSGTQSTLVASMSGTISPNSYFLIKHPTGYTGSTTADSQYSTSASVTADNVVILYSDAGTTIIDKVGFGTPFDFETLPFTSNPTAAQSLKRIENIDTDNNSVDFELILASPRNSSTSSATPTPIFTSTPLPTEVPTPTASPTIEPTSTPTATPEPTPTPTFSPTPMPTVIATPIPTPTPKVLGEHEGGEIKLPLKFRCKIKKHEYKFGKHRIGVFKVHFFRR